MASFLQAFFFNIYLRVYENLKIARPSNKAQVGFYLLNTPFDGRIQQGNCKVPHHAKSSSKCLSGEVKGHGKTNYISKEVRYLIIYKT